MARRAVPRAAPGLANRAAFSLRCLSCLRRFAARAMPSLIRWIPS